MSASMRASAGLRDDIAQNRFAELREGVWIRPDNVKIILPDEVLSRVQVLHSYDDSPADLAALLWDLPAWARCRRPNSRRHGRRRRRFRPIRRGRRHGASSADDPCCRTSCCPTAGPVPHCVKSYAQFAAELVAKTGNEHELLKAQ